MAKLRFTGSADGSATYAGKYEVTTGSVIDASDGDVNALLQTGVFEVVEDEPVKKESKKSDDDNSKSSKK